jgi:predicted phage terminase large subunit-like protein
MRPFARGATNPEPNWVKDLIRWWLTDDGYADPKKSGVIRWLYRYDDYCYWFDTQADAYADLRDKGLSQHIHPMSFTFIPSKLDDNQILLQNDPSYYSKLSSLPTIERKRLLEGNWFVKPTGKVFKPDDFQIYALLPDELDVKILTIDTAQNTKSANDYTVCQCWGRKFNRAYLINQMRGKFDFSMQEQIIYNMYLQEKPNWVLIEHAANGLPLFQNLRKKGVPIMTITRKKDKYQRAMEVQGYVQSGFVYIKPSSAYYNDRDWETKEVR